MPATPATAHATSPPSSGGSHRRGQRDQYRRTDARPATSSPGACVDLRAPGPSSVSAVFNGGIGAKSGTSMATPHLAGVAALYQGLKAMRPPRRCTSGSRSTAPCFWHSAPVFLDDFETDRGQLRDDTGSDTPTTGVWERVNPEPTSMPSGPRSWARSGADPTALSPAGLPDRRWDRTMSTVV
ncbi:S8 family serine peptidase [Streptomyces sp. NPDC003023]|uniref:S8 family serine peptidase n=1 Tax=Streptomyces sp. NPDC003023 TaxID=3364675 RepID=UPI0036903A01